MVDPAFRLVEPPRLPQVEWTTRRGPAIRRGPNSSEDVLCVDLFSGSHSLGAFACADRGASPIGAYSGTTEQLEAELRQRSAPRAIHVSPYADPFPPLASLQDLTARVVETLSNRQIESWLLTRGYIRPAARSVLSARRDKVRVTIALSTLDSTLQRSCEPWTASPRLRLRQFSQLRALGIPAHLAIEPLIPGLTDTPDNLREVLATIAGLGLNHVTVSYLVLGPQTHESLVAALQPHGWDDMVLDEYIRSASFTTPGGRIRLLPKSRRQRGYAALMALAAEHGIRVSISAAGNPDFAAARTSPIHARHRLLPSFLSMSRQLHFA